MESGLKSLFIRRRSKSKHPAVKDTSQDAFRQTSSYAAVSSGPAPKFGALPLKPSQDMQPRKSFIHRKTKSDGLQESLQVAESANIGRPRTSPGVKPYFVGVSKPNGSALTSASSSRGASVDAAAAEGVAPPPVPSLPEHLDSLQGPRYHDIMQFAAKQQISRATFNEHIANRNMGLPRKSVDIFEAEVNQLSGRTYNEYVAMRNIDLVRRSINRFEHDVALRNAVLPDSQRISSDATRASIEGLRYQSGGTGEEKTLNKTPGQGVVGAETDTNTHVVRAGKGKPLKTRNGGQISGSDTASKANASRLQASQSSKVGSHSRQHSWKQNNHSRELSFIPQSRTADFMPREWLSYGNTAISSDARTRSMTAAITPSLQNVGTGDRHAPAHHPSNEESQSLAQTFWDARNQLSQHGTSRSLSMLEGSSRLDAFRRKTSMGQQAVVTERSALRGRPSSRSDKTQTARIPQDMPLAYPHSDTSPHAPSMGMGITFTRKRIDTSGRTVMDLTGDGAHRHIRNAGHSIHYELPGSPQHEIFHDTNRVNRSRSPPELSNNHTPEQHMALEINAFESLRSSKPTSSRAGRISEHENPSIQLSGKASSEAESTPAIGEYSEQATSRSTSQSVGVSGAIDSQLASFHNQVTVPLQSLASQYRQQDQAVNQDYDTMVSRPSEHVYSTPESLKSNAFIDPSRAFGVTARDFAVSPIHKQSQDTLNQMSQPQDETKPDKLPPFPTTRLPTKQDKVMHHISSFTFPPTQSRTRQSDRDQIAFDEDAFERKQSEARTALLKLEQDLQENFDFAFDSLNVGSAQGPPVHFRNLSLEAGGPVAPISRFSSVHKPIAVYQNNFNDNVSHPSTSVGEKSPLRGSFNGGVAMANGVSTPNTHTTPRGKNRNSAISNISKTEAERSWSLDSAPAPTIPLSSAYDRGRTMTSRQPLHGRMHSTASTGSGFSAFSVPPQLVPERTSSLRDSDVPPFHIGDAGWE